MTRTPIMLIVVASLASVAPTAHAGTAAEPELRDGAEDCRLAYGGAYLDLAAAWIDDESEASFRVNLALHRFDPTLAEGAGFLVQFRHRQVTWGIVVQYQPVTDDGWIFQTGQARNADHVEFTTLEAAEGAFVPGTSPRLWVTFSKLLLPPGNATDDAVTDFWAASADLRPAYPFLMADDVDPQRGNGRWLLCDEATGTGTYRLRTRPSDAGEQTAGEPNDLGSATTPGVPTLVALLGSVGACLAFGRRRSSS